MVEIKIENEYELLERNRKFAAVLRIARAVPSFEDRLRTHIDPIKAEIDWPKTHEELVDADEEVALH